MFLHARTIIDQHQEWKLRPRAYLDYNLIQGMTTSKNQSYVSFKHNVVNALGNQLPEEDTELSPKIEKSHDTHETEPSHGCTGPGSNTSTSNARSIDHFPENEFQADKFPSGIDYTFCAGIPLESIPNKRVFHSKKYQSVSLEKVILYSCLYAHSFIKQRFTKKERLEKRLTKAVDSILESLEMSLEMGQWRRTVKGDQAEIRHFQVLSKFVKEFPTLEFAEANLVLDSIDDDLIRQLMDGVASIQGATRKQGEVHSKLRRTLESFGLSARLLEGQKRKWSVSTDSLFRLIIKCSVKTRLFSLSKIQIGEFKPRQSNTMRGISLK